MNTTTEVSLRRNDAVRLSVGITVPLLLAILLVAAIGTSGLVTALLLCAGIAGSIATTYLFVLQPLIATNWTACRGRDHGTCRSVVVAQRS